MALASLGLGLASAGLGKLFGNSEDVSLQDLRSPEQIAAQQTLAQLGQTGAGAGINLGEAYGGSLGNFDQTTGEQQALSQLQKLFGGQDITKARETFSNLADTTFDPSDPKSGFAAFQRQLARTGKEASSALDRESAITGSRFGTAIAGEKADLGARLQDISASKLAELFQSSRAQQLAGAQGLQGLVGTQANLAGSAAQLAAQERDLKNQEAQVKFNEFQRQRGETLGRIDLLTQAANRNPYMGVSSIPGSPSPFSTLANSIFKGIGENIGTEGFFKKVPLPKQKPYMDEEGGYA